MRKIIAILLTCSILVGCGSIKYFKKDYRSVQDYSERIELLRRNFPEIYDMYRYGSVIVEDVYTYTADDGTTHVGIEYRYR